MCGLAGFVGEGGRDDLAAMTRALVHRGPDEDGSHIDERHRVFLGFRRLVVIDPAGGSQPMWNEDDTVCVVFNGEIYNQAELRTAARGAGSSLSLGPFRHRNPRSRLRGMGRRSAAAPQRHVRFCGVGSAAPAPVCRPAIGSAKSRSITWRGPGFLCLRLRVDGAGPASAGRPHARPPRPAEILRLRLRPGAQRDLSAARESCRAAPA